MHTMWLPSLLNGNLNQWCNTIIHSCILLYNTKRCSKHSWWQSLINNFFAGGRWVTVSAVSRVKQKDKKKHREKSPRWPVTNFFCFYFFSDVGFEVPDKFLVGYALDYNEYYRDLEVSIGLIVARRHMMYAQQDSSFVIWSCRLRVILWGMKDEFCMHVPYDNATEVRLILHQRPSVIQYKFILSVLSKHSVVDL